VVNLHACFDKAGDLAKSLAHAGDEIANGSEVQISVTAEGQAQTLDPMAMDEIYCIGREAMVNAIRHSKGRSVEVEVDYAAWELRLRIRDDGRGIDPNILQSGRAGHIGLAVMRERAERIGGNWISSAGQMQGRKLN